MSVNSQQAVDASAPPARPAPAIRSALLVVAAASGAAVVVWTFATSIAGVTLAVDGSTHDVGLASVLVSSLLIGLAGAGTMRLLIRRTRRGRRNWTVLAGTVLALSLFGPTDASSTAAWAVLSCLHLVTGGVLIVGLRRITLDDQHS